MAGDIEGVSDHQHRRVGVGVLVAAVAFVVLSFVAVVTKKRTMN